MLGVTILGNNSALPAFDRHPTSQVVTLDDQLFLVDCGEGAQIQLARYKIRWGRINHIFISHLHGDHYFGLPGLLNSMSLLNREQDVHLYAPAPLKAMLDMQFEAATTKLSYQLHFHPLENEGMLFKTDRVAISTFQTKHRIPCFGFKFEEVKPPRRLIPEKAIEHEVPSSFYDRLKMGEDYTNKKGEIIQNNWVTEAAPLPKSYAFCADTIFDEELIEKVKGVSLLYHETTYLKDMDDRAAARYHSTTTQAATIAKKAGVKQLLIGHFSSKYDKLDQFEIEAKEIFPNTQLAIEGATYKA